MDNIALRITFESAGGNPVTLASVHDRGLLLRVAESALDEAERRIAEFAAEDRILGELQRVEASRLRTSLEMLLPELRRAGTPLM